MCQRLMRAVCRKSVLFRVAEYSGIRQELDTKQANKSEDLLSPSLSNRKALLCVYVKGEKGKFFIHNHCYVWELPLLLQKIHKSSLHLFINVQYDQRFLVRGGNIRCPLFHMSRHIYQLLHSYHSPELIMGTESRAPSQKENPFKRKFFASFPLMTNGQPWQPDEQECS